MSYANSIIGLFSENTTHESPVELDETRSKYLYTGGIKRLEIPKSTIVHEEHMEDINRIKLKFIKDGKRKLYPRNIDKELEKHICYFLNCLDVYDMIQDRQVFSTNEIYYRCLAEGPSFSNFIKKSRASSLQYIESIEEEDLTEYVHTEYKGYDDIIHERYLINWDETMTTIDYPYAFINPIEIDKSLYRDYVERMLIKIKCIDYKQPDIIKIIEPVAGKKTSLVTSKEETTLLKNSWGAQGIGEMFCTRRVVPVCAGNTRDTGVPDIETLNKLKLIHSHSRYIAERSKHSANCSLSQLQKRYGRVKSGSFFAHIDFKKFGLTVQREIGNIILEMIGKEHLKVNEVYLQVNKETLRTKRGGGSLGWLDPLFAIGVDAILRGIIEDNQWEDTDFIIFNDDVEISFHLEDERECILRKDYICGVLEDFGFLLSYRKIYCSRMSVFLENYHSAQYCDMTKKQLAIAPYAGSLSTNYEWKKKYLFSEGWNRVRSRALEERIMAEKNDGTDIHRPYEIGGWKKDINIQTGLNDALINADRREIEFFIKMSRYKEPHLMPKWVTVNLESLIWRKTRMINESIEKTVESSEVERDPSRRLSEEERSALRLVTLGERFYAPEEFRDEDETPPHHYYWDTGQDVTEIGMSSEEETAPPALPPRR